MSCDNSASQTLGLAPCPRRSRSQRLEGLPWVGLEALGELDPQLLEDPQWVRCRCSGTVPAWATAVTGAGPKPEAGRLCWKSEGQDSMCPNGRCPQLGHLRGHVSSLSPFSHQRSESPAPGDQIMPCEPEQGVFSPKALPRVAPALPPLPTCSCPSSLSL